MGFKFRRQHPFGLYVLDFYCHSRRLCIEIDGKLHDYPIQKVLDEDRTQFIESFGVQVIRFKNEDVLNRLESVTNNITLILRADPLCASAKALATRGRVRVCEWKSINLYFQKESLLLIFEIKIAGRYPLG